MKETVSFVIPCYRSEHTLEGVVSEIIGKMKTLEETYVFDIILVNDCSPDGTWDVIEKLNSRYPFIKGINFSRNFGQHSALMAGIAEADGEYVVCLDDDGQTPADEADKLLNKIRNGYDVVYARYAHKEHSAFRNWGTRLNDKMACALLDKPRELYLSSYFCMRKYIADEVVKYTNPYPYLAGLIIRATHNIANVDIHHRQRDSGSSGYTFRKLVSLWFNGFTSFSVKPLRIASFSGFIVAFIGMLYAVFIVIHKIVNPEIAVGWSSLMAALLIIGGMLMLMLGLIGEYIGRIYISLNKMPQYVIKEKLEAFSNREL